MTNQIPIAVGLAICEQIIVEENTRNVTLVNCFVERSFEQFPSGPAPFVAFAYLTNGLGEITLEVVVERLDTLDVVHRYSRTAPFTNPLHTIRYAAFVRRCFFPIPGHYEISLRANGETIAQQRIAIKAKEIKP